MKTVNRFYLVALLSLLIPAFSITAENLSYSAVEPLVKDFLDLKKHTDKSCDDFCKALIGLLNKSPKYRNDKYRNFSKELDSKLRTKNANIIGIFLYQKRELFDGLKALVEGRSKEELISIIDKRLKK